MLEQLQSKNVVQLVGQCDDAILTEYHPTGTLGDLIESEEYERFNLIDRIKLALRYVEIVSYLHDSPGILLSNYAWFWRIKWPLFILDSM